MKCPTPVAVKLAARSIGESIATWRKLYSITSQELADRVSVSRATLSRLENGDPSVSFETFCAYAKASACSTKFPRRSTLMKRTSAESGPTKPFRSA